jgi:hypothetical protein
MKRNDEKTAQMSFHLYIENINDELKSYLPYILALVHSSKAVFWPSGATQQHYEETGSRASGQTGHFLHRQKS